LIFRALTNEAHRTHPPIAARQQKATRASLAGRHAAQQNLRIRPRPAGGVHLHQNIGALSHDAHLPGPGKPRLADKAEGCVAGGAGHQVRAIPTAWIIRAHHPHHHAVAARAKGVIVARARVAPVARRPTSAVVRDRVRRDKCTASLARLYWKPKWAQECTNAAQGLPGPLHRKKRVT